MRALWRAQAAHWARTGPVPDDGPDGRWPMTVAALYLAAAFVGGLVAVLLRLPALVGFLVAGFALGAAGAPDLPYLSTIADLGVVLLLFAIGLKLDPRFLLRREVWLTTTVHLLVSVAIGVGFLGLLAVLGAALVAERVVRRAGADRVRAVVLLHRLRRQDARGPLGRAEPVRADRGRRAHRAGRRRRGVHEPGRRLHAEPLGVRAGAARARRLGAAPGLEPDRARRAAGAVRRDGRPGPGLRAVRGGRHLRRGRSPGGRRPAGAPPAGR